MGPTISSNIIKLDKIQGTTIVWTKYLKKPSGLSRLAISGNEVVFLSEKNGAVFAATLTCLEEETDPRADLALIVLPYNNYVPNMVAGGTSSVGIKVYNIGIAPANGFEVRAVLSTDNVYSPGSDITIGSIDGVNVAPNSYSNLTINHAVPANIASGSYYYLMVADAGNIVPEGEENNNTFTTQINVTGGAPPSGCNAITITPAPGQITIAGATAPHVLIKVFRPNWTVAFECLDNCANPLVVSGLSSGTYHVQVKLIDNSWGAICYLERDVNVSAVTALKFSDDRQRLAIDKIYPNPSRYNVMLELYSKQEQPAVLDFYDVSGRLVHRMEVPLNEGSNEVEVPVYDWKSGAYFIIARGEGMPAYGRLMKVWEE
jgi:hypothetical protein